MKIFANKSIWKKLVIIIICITIFSFVAPKPVAASIGGTLMEPICNLLVGLADGVVWAIQKFAISQDISFVNVDLTTGLLSKIVGVALVIVGVAATIALSFALAAVGGASLGVVVLINLGKLLAGAATIGGLVLTTGVVSLTSSDGSDIEESYTVATQLYDGEAFEVLDEISLPLIAMSPEEIFKNEIPLFDVNFFDPSEETYTSEYAFARKITASSTSSISWSKYIKYTINFYYADGYYHPIWSSDNKTVAEYVEKYKDDGYTCIEVTFTVKYGKSSTDDGYKYYKDLSFDVNGETYHSQGMTEVTGDYKDDDWIRNYSSGEFNSLQSYINGSEDGNYLNGCLSDANLVISMGNIETATDNDCVTDEGSISDLDTTSEETETEEQHSLAYQLSDIISAWYYRLLIIAAVGMLSVLVYIGIRILISSTAPDKAKYKQLLGDWLIGVVLLFTMHYIMVFANIFAAQLTDFLSSAGRRKL